MLHESGSRLQGFVHHTSNCDQQCREAQRDRASKLDRPMFFVLAIVCNSPRKPFAVLWGDSKAAEILVLSGCKLKC